jgi:hypothetical protein
LSAFEVLVTLGAVLETTFGFSSSQGKSLSSSFTSSSSISSASVSLSGFN